ncbi:MAG: hypothetical protein IPJ24_14850 [bacterium]|nr:hypothetical protein [bacterium]
MKRFAGLPALCCLGLVLAMVTAAPARAQLSCSEPDQFALVFDNGYINHTPTLGEPFGMHAVLINPTGQPIDAFEFRLNLPPLASQLYVLQALLPPGSLNIGTSDATYREFVVGLSVPRPAVNDRIELVTFELMCLTSTPNQDFFVQETWAPAIDGRIAYNVTQDVTSFLHAMTPVSGDFAQPLARLFPTTQLNYCDGGPELPEFRIDVSAAAGGVQDPLARAGSSGSATDEFDLAWERPEPALPPGNYVCASYWHPDWPLGPRFDNDIRAPFDPAVGTEYWPLVVETDRNDLVTVTFAPNFTADDGIRLDLYDSDRRVYVPLFPHLTYTYRNHGLPTARRLSLRVGDNDIPPIYPTARSLIPGWSLVSLPLVPPAGSGTVGTALLGYAPGYAIAYTHDPATGYAPALANQPVVMGQGYWVGTTSAYQMVAQGTMQIDGAVLATTPGWNLIGYPCWIAGRDDGIVVVHDGDPMGWTAAVQAGLVSPDLQGYSAYTGQYVDITTLYPYQAYWVNVLAPDVKLIIYWRSMLYAAAMAPATDKADPALDITDEAWRTDFTLTDAAGSERIVTLGVDPAGTAGFDPQLDRPQPPAAPVPGPEFCLLHPDWHLAAGARFTRDIVGPTSPLSWSLTLASPAAGPATLRWDTTPWPADLDLELYLPAENRVLLRSLRAASSADITLDSSGPLTLVVRTPDSASGVGNLPSSMDGHLSVSPNPFNPRATLSFTLSRAATAEVRIYSLRGELVRVVGGGSSLGAGPQRLEWDGTDSHGRSVPSGSYFGRLHVDGAVSGETVRMSLVR